MKEIEQAIEEDGGDGSENAVLVDVSEPNYIHCGGNLWNKIYFLRIQIHQTQPLMRNVVLKGKAQQVMRRRNKMPKLGGKAQL